MGRRKFLWTVWENRRGHYNSYEEFKESWSTDTKVWKTIGKDLKVSLENKVNSILDKKRPFDIPSIDINRSNHIKDTPLKHVHDSHKDVRRVNDSYKHVRNIKQQTSDMTVKHGRHHIPGTSVKYHVADTSVKHIHDSYLKQIKSLNDDARGRDISVNDNNHINEHSEVSRKTHRAHRSHKHHTSHRRHRKI